jgi:hypothetical protein
MTAMPTLMDWIVEPAICKHGPGRRLVEEAEIVAASDGAQWLYVIGNRKAGGF